MSHAVREFCLPAPPELKAQAPVNALPCHQKGVSMRCRGGGDVREADPVRIHVTLCVPKVPLEGTSP
eukprot:1162049-Pelagomonas_calceolata.AAC.11